MYAPGRHQTRLQIGTFSAESAHRGTHACTRTSSIGLFSRLLIASEDGRVVELSLVREHVAVDVRRDGKVALADRFADPAPGRTGKVQERHAAMTQVVGAEERDAGSDARPPDRRPELVDAEALEDLALGDAIVACTSSVTASKRRGGEEIHRAVRVLLAAAETRQRPRCSSTSAQVSAASSPTRHPARIEYGQREAVALR